MNLGRNEYAPSQQVNHKGIFHKNILGLHGWLKIGLKCFWINCDQADSNRNYKFANHLTCELPNIFELTFWRHPNMHFKNYSLKECFPNQFIKGGWSIELKWYNNCFNSRVNQTWRNECVEVFKNNKRWGSEIWNWVLFSMF